MKMVPSFLNHILRNSGAEKNIYLVILLNDSTKHDLAEITVFFTELFETDSIRGSLNEIYRFFVGTACTVTERGISR